MLVYRLGSEEYIHDLSGTGARLFGGRWNHKGTPQLYTSQHCSLALLEVIVNTPQKLLPDNIHLLKLSVPGDLKMKTIRRDELHDSWRQYPAPDLLADIGTQWINSKDSVGLKVPSVLVHDEWNILLNPQHQHFHKITIESISPFSIDSRF